MPSTAQQSEYVSILSSAYAGTEILTDTKRLEQLMGSQTVFGTLKSAFTLRIFGVSTLILILLWSFNPVGGQAALRSVSLQSRSLRSLEDVSYYVANPIKTAKYSSLQGVSAFTFGKPFVSSLFGLAILSPDAAVQFPDPSNTTSHDAAVAVLGGLEAAALKSQSDPWGNVRIPVLHLLPGYDSEDAMRWVKVPQNEIAPYASMIGVPIRSLPQLAVGNLTLTIPTTYTTFDVSTLYSDATLFNLTITTVHRLAEPRTLRLQCLDRRAPALMANAHQHQCDPLLPSLSRFLPRHTHLIHQRTSQRSLRKQHSRQLQCPHPRFRVSRPRGGQRCHRLLYNLRSQNMVR